MAGCGDDGTPDVDLAEVIVVNTPDSFTATLVGFGYSGSINRTWSCSGTQARLSLGTALLGGSVHIRIDDDAGTSVYDNHHGATMGGLTGKALRDHGGNRHESARPAGPALRRGRRMLSGRHLR
jgi:hypothetical protein